MQKLINLGYALEWNSCHEWGFMSIRFFLCPGALWRLLFENVRMKLSKRMGKRPAWPPVILNVREGNARQGEIESGHRDPKELMGGDSQGRGQNSGSSGQQMGTDYLMLTESTLNNGLDSHRGAAWTWGSASLAGRTVWRVTEEEGLCGTCELAIKGVLTGLSVVD